MFDRNNALILVGLVAVGVFLFFKNKDKKDEAPQSSSYTPRQKPQPRAQTAPQETVPATEAVATESKETPVENAVNVQNIPAQVTTQPAPKPEELNTEEEKKKILEAVYAAKQSKLSPDEKVENLKDYSEFLKPDLLKKYQEYKFKELVTQSESYLKDPAGYERVYGESRTSEVKNFLNDIQIAMEARKGNK